MDNEVLQVPAMQIWDIRVGDFRHVSICDASADMIKDTAIALSKTYPDKRVDVVTDNHIRWFFQNGEEINPFSDERVAELCPFSTSQYRQCWLKGQSFPVVAWVDVESDGKPRIL